MRRVAQLKPVAAGDDDAALRSFISNRGEQRRQDIQCLRLDEIGAVTGWLEIVLKVIEDKQRGLLREWAVQKIAQPFPECQWLVENLIDLNTVLAVAQSLDEPQLVDRGEADQRLISIALHPVAEPGGQTALSQSAHSVQQHAFVMPFITLKTLQDAQASLNRAPASDEGLPFADLDLAPGVEKFKRGLADCQFFSARMFERSDIFGEWSRIAIKPQ